MRHVSPLLIDQLYKDTRLRLIERLGQENMLLARLKKYLEKKSQHLKMQIYVNSGKVKLYFNIPIYNNNNLTLEYLSLLIYRGLIL